MQNHIAALRHKRGWSLNDLARAAGTTKAQIQKLERGERRLSLEWLERIARALGVKVSELLPESEVACRHSEAEREVLAALSLVNRDQQVLIAQLIKDLVTVTLKLSQQANAPPGTPELDAQLMRRWALLDDAQRSWALKMLDLARERPSDVSHAA